MALWRVGSNSFDQNLSRNHGLSWQVGSNSFDQNRCSLHHCSNVPKVFPAVMGKHNSSLSCLNKCYSGQRVFLTNSRDTMGGIKFSVVMGSRLV